MFFRRIFGSLPANEITAQVWLTAQAAEQFKVLQKRDHTAAERYTNCFSDMRSPTMLQLHLHSPNPHQKQTYAFYKKGHTKERPFFYTEPPLPTLRTRKGHIERVIIAGLSQHVNEHDYDLEAEDWLKQAPFTAHCRFETLLPQERVLIVPLGTSPMVATQLFTLLQKQRKTIEAVALLYPERQRDIVQGAKMLYKVFTDKRLSSLRDEHTPDVQCFPIVNISDIDTQEACAQFSHTLAGAITKLKAGYPAATLQLSVSGGRKAMAILTYFAAQYYGLQHVWHTLITDPVIEERVEQETALYRLEFISDRQKAERLFLHTYPHEAFTAFSIPVIPFSTA
jgi:CRISPR-associated Csx14 family protein